LNAEVLQRLELAQQSWDEALARHWAAPPAPGYAQRLRALARAAEEQASAFRAADREGLPWRPILGAARAISPPPELSPHFNRPGPRELWSRFDSQLLQLGEALESPSPIRIAHAFQELSETLEQLAAANLQAEQGHGRSRMLRPLD
jgi:hypothetical protein